MVPEPAARRRRFYRRAAAGSGSAISPDPFIASPRQSLHYTFVLLLVLPAPPLLFDPLHHPSPNCFFRSGSICSCPSPHCLFIFFLPPSQAKVSCTTIQTLCSQDVCPSFSQVLGAYSLSLGFQDPNLLFLGQLSIKLRKKLGILDGSLWHWVVS